MKLATAILKNLLLPQLEKDNQFVVSKISESFWESLVTSLFNFETDAKPIYVAVYSLELNNPEKVIKKLNSVYKFFINELAENYVLGYTSEVFDDSLLLQNQTFLRKVHFFRNLEKVIKKAERKRIKEELPTSFEKLTFELSNTEMANALKKKGREDLKKKMRNWDEELVDEKPVPTMKLAKKNQKSKVIYLSWVKYAVAACFVLGLGVWFYTNQDQGTLPDNNVVNNPDKGTNVLPSIASEALAEVTTVTKSSTVIENNGLGFGTKTKKISLIENNQQDRIISISKAIEKYRKDLEKEFGKHQVGDSKIINELEKRINLLQNELNLLKEREKQYLFDGKVLTLYVLTSSLENRVLLYEDKYYLKKETVFYTLSVSKQPQPYKKVTDTALVTALDKILFDNGF
jgi:hypothetical protein